MTLLPLALRERLRSWREKIEQKFEDLCRRPLFGGLVTITAAFAGVYGSLYSTPVKNGLEVVFSRVPNPLRNILTPDAVQVTVFWLLIISAGALFVGNQWAQARQNKRINDDQKTANNEQKNANEEQREANKRLSATIDDLPSLPPSDYLRKVQKYYRICMTTTEGVISAQDRAILQQGIRLALKSLITMAEEYFPRETGYRYGANIMLAQPLSALTDDDIEKCKTRLMFIGDPETVKFRAYSCILDLATDLSTSSDQGDKPDPEVGLFAFLIPMLTPEITGGNVRTSTLIPGAPTAYATSTPILYDSHESLMRDAKDRDILRPQRQQIEDYLKSPAGQKVQSFLSIPMSWNGGEIIGVVNIHRDKPGLLPGTSMQRFVPLVEPLVLSMARLVIQLRKL